MARRAQHLRYCSSRSKATLCERSERADNKFHITLPLGRFAFGKTQRGPHCARQASQRLLAWVPQALLLRNAMQQIVKPARLHFARTARALRDAHVCERGALSEFRAARTCASYWFDNATKEGKRREELHSPARILPASPIVAVDRFCVLLDFMFVSAVGQATV